MVVNRKGLRYADETLYSRNLMGWFAGEALENQPDGICYAIMDSRTLNEMTKTKKENISGLEVACSRFTPGDIEGDRKIGGWHGTFSTTAGWWLQNRTNSKLKPNKDG